MIYVLCGILTGALWAWHIWTGEFDAFVYGHCVVLLWISVHKDNNDSR